MGLLYESRGGPIDLLDSSNEEDDVEKDNVGEIIQSTNSVGEMEMYDTYDAEDSNATQNNLDVYPPPLSKMPRSQRGWVIEKSRLLRKL